MGHLAVERQTAHSSGNNHGSLPTASPTPRETIRLRAARARQAAAAEPALVRPQASRRDRRLPRLTRKRQAATRARSLLRLGKRQHASPLTSLPRWTSNTSDGRWSPNTPPPSRCRRPRRVVDAHTSFPAATRISPDGRSDTGIARSKLTLTKTPMSSAGSSRGDSCDGVGSDKGPLCNGLVGDRRVVTPSAGMREHVATDWSWYGWVRSGPLVIVRVSPAARRRQGRSSGGALHLDRAAWRARLRSDYGLGGLCGGVTDHASVDEV